MTPDSRRPATGPLIMEQIRQLTETVNAIRETQTRRERQLLHLSGQLDRFLAAELDLTGTLVQVREVVGNSRDGLADVRYTLEDLKRTIHAVLQLTAGDPQHVEHMEHARERNGRINRA